MLFFHNNIRSFFFPILLEGIHKKSINWLSMTVIFINGCGTARSAKYWNRKCWNFQEFSVRRFLLAADGISPTLTQWRQQKQGVSTLAVAFTTSRRKTGISGRTQVRLPLWVKVVEPTRGSGSGMGVKAFHQPSPPGLGEQYLGEFLKE